MRRLLCSLLPISVLLLGGAASTIHAQQSQEKTESMADCPMHAKHMAEAAQHADKVHQHSAELNARGDKAMGFDQMKTTHHFRLLANGGAIEVAANDPNDTVSRDQIRQHLARIAQMFAEGNFDIPFAVHAQTPAGVPTLKQLREQITYAFEETAAGGLVRISTADAKALAAIHEFLRFQIEEHRTGDTQELRIKKN